MTVKLAVLEHRLLTTASTETVNQSYIVVKQGIRHLLSCFPLNGNGWMRSAMSTMRMEGPTESVMHEVELSELTSPREGWLLGSRIPFLISLSQTQDPRAIEALNNDLDTLFRWMPEWQVRAIFEAVGDYGKSIMRARFSAGNADVIAAMDPDRLELLYRIMGLKFPEKDCARYFRRLKTCVGRR